MATSSSLRALGSLPRTPLPSLLRIALCAFFFIAALPFARADNNCAWLNEATASGLLGGDATGDSHAAAGAQPAVCTFTQQSAGVKRTLRITVEIAADAHARLIAMAQNCGIDAFALKAIGNEAMACSADDRKAGPGERVIGRVRDQVFTITIASSLKGDPAFSRDILKTKIYTAAEQVAGNLF
jgi:hypothetical protein